MIAASAFHISAGGTFGIKLSPSTLPTHHTAPWASTYRAYSECELAMYRRLRLGPAKTQVGATLRQADVGQVACPAG